MASATEPLVSVPITRWTPALRLGFRFCFIYFGLYSLLTQIFTGLIPIANVDIQDLSTHWPVRPIIFWTASHIFHVAQPLVYQFSGSGDKYFDWILVFLLLLFSLLATAVWSLLDRDRPNYEKLYDWFRLFIRSALAGQLIAYGLFKIIPEQMPGPSLGRLLEHFGDMSPMGVLWASVGASPAYETFTGCAEFLAGILIFIPRTTTLGALIALADMIQVFTLNMTYDVCVKLASFHYILLSLFLLAPDFRRLADFFLLNRPAGTSTARQLFSTTRANRLVLIAQVSFAVVLIAVTAYSSWSNWKKYSGGRLKSPLYGIWEVEQQSIDGELRPPLLTDSTRWRRLVFDVPERMSFQRLDDSFERRAAAIDVGNKTLTLTKDDDKNWKASFTFTRPATDQLTLDGSMDGHSVHLQLKLFDRNQFLLINRGFHWIQEHPFNR
jgi:uncharacterized membrane protein YphA (DoxX/SURF4 family)